MQAPAPGFLFTRRPRDPVNATWSFLLTQVHKILRGRGEALQYSVFQCSLNRAEYIQLQADLWPYIDVMEDRIILVDVGPQDGRGKLAVESWGRALEEPPEPGVAMVF